MNNKIKVLTWHIHGSYLYYLTQANCEFFIPFKKNNESGYIPLGKNFSWGKNVHQIPADTIKNINLDLILFQSNYSQHKIYLEDQYQLLSESQKNLPKIYIEHDPPRQHPTDNKHIVNDPNILLVHVTNFNNIMWDNGPTPTKVIEHGVIEPKNIIYKGDLPRGIVVINNLNQRGRRLGLDIFEKARKYVPLDIIGMDSEKLEGLGEISHKKLPEFISHYRFLFNPIRCTSLGLSVCEAMIIGMPIVGLATTEMVTTIENDFSGYINTNVDTLIEKMQILLKKPKKAAKLGRNAKKYASARFNIKRFTKDWENTFIEMIKKHKTQTPNNKIIDIYNSNTLSKIQL